MRSTLPLVVLLAACHEQEFQIQSNPPPAGDLTIAGRACNPVTRTWLENALVYTVLYDDDDVVYDSRDDTTDADGNYLLEDLVAEKDYEIYTQVGQDIVDEFVVHLGDEDLVIPPAACSGDVSLDVAVITGTFDEIQPILEAIGFTGIKVIDGQASNEIVDFLTDPVAMAEYDMILFDGGAKEDGVVYGAGPVQQIKDDLARYASDGGVVFGSDWAYDVIEQVWPDRIDFYGDDTVPDAAQVGEAGTITATVADQGLQALVGATTVDVTYDLAVWPVVEAVDPAVTVYLQGDAPYREGFSVSTVPASPLLVGFDEGAGHVLFTTYRNTANNNSSMLGVLVALMQAIGTGGATAGTTAP